MKFIVSIFIALSFSQAFAFTSRWSEADAQKWGVVHGWMAGSNYIPRDAINSIEMWDATTFNPVLIDQELGLAEGLGFKTVRVFLNDLVWQADPSGFESRLDQFLAVAERHHIRPLLVFFDSCWGANPKLGPQPAPVAGVHNSGWVQSPGISSVLDPLQHGRLKVYVTTVLSHFKNDSRILAWDLWNEPDNINGANDKTYEEKELAVRTLLRKVFQWARAADPSQPLTSGIWNGNWSKDSSLNAMEKTQVELSDVISFHNYDDAKEFETRVRQLKRYSRPMLATEYMARPRGSTFQAILPLAKTHNVIAYNWGFVAGKTQTYFPWDSWEHPYPAMPKVWFHDIFFEDGRPYDQAEVDFIQTLTR